MFWGVDRDKTGQIGFFGSSGGTSGFGLQIGTVPTRSGRLASMHLDAVLSALHDQSLFCNIVKCEFALDSVRFLGHIVDGNRLRPDPEKIMVVRDWKEPNSVTGVRQFLGFTNYFRRFIEVYSFIARPLEELTGKNKRFSWNEECQAAFEALKKALISVPVLRLPDVSKPFRLVTDASNTALAGVLLQQDETEDWHPVAYISRRLHAPRGKELSCKREGNVCRNSCSSCLANLSFQTI